MNIVMGKEAKTDLREVDGNIKEEISQAIEKLGEEPLPDNSYVIQLPDATEMQVLKLQEEDRNSELNHRVTYDIIENDYVRVYGIFSRQPGYQNIKEKTSNRI